MQTNASAYNHLLRGVTEDTLKSICNEHPYFSPAVILLADKTRQEDDVEKAALHAPNLYWLHYLLSEEKNDGEKDISSAQEIKTLVPQPEGATVLKEDALLFEPLHTTDYFASQGIKISAEIKADDKLGKQLKSFTEWLKTMKKIHYQPAATETTSDENFHPVLSMAEKSNTTADVLTESMAEILAGQGKVQQAADLYHKLSLLNPSKSAYFAAKIEKLKEN